MPSELVLVAIIAASASLLGGAVSAVTTVMVSGGAERRRRELREALERYLLATSPFFTKDASWASTSKPGSEARSAGSPRVCCS